MTAWSQSSGTGLVVETAADAFVTDLEGWKYIGAVEPPAGVIVRTKEPHSSVLVIMIIRLFAK